MQNLKRKQPKIIKLGKGCQAGCKCGKDAPIPQSSQSSNPNHQRYFIPSTEDQLVIDRQRKRGRDEAGIDASSLSGEQIFDTEDFGLSEDQVPSQGSSPKRMYYLPSTEDQHATTDSPQQAWDPPLPSTEDQADHPFRPPDRSRVIMTEAAEGPKLDRAEFLKEQRKKVARMRSSKKELVNLSKISTEHVKAAFDKCSSCPVKTRSCPSIRLDIIRHLRGQLYGPGVQTKTRIKILCQWLVQIVEANKMKFAAERKLYTKDCRLSEWFIYDFTYSISEEVRRISCCFSCFQAATGFSASTIQKYLKLIREGNLSVSTEEHQNLRVSQMKSPERMMVFAWLEMKVEQQACQAPDGKKSELPEVATRRNLYEMFKQDWKAGVLNGTYHRVFRGRRRKKQKKPKGVPQKQPPPQVDEEGNAEPSDKEKLNDINHHDPPTYQFFCRVWKCDFNQDYKIPRSHRRFTQCNWCGTCKENIKYAKDKDKLYWQQCLFGHYAWLTKQREKYYKHQHKAQHRPGK